MDCGNCAAAAEAFAFAASGALTSGVLSAFLVNDIVCLVMVSDLGEKPKEKPASGQRPLSP